MLNNKVAVGVAGAITVVAAITAVWWFGKESWDKVEEAATFKKLTEIYTRAMNEHPNDRMKASFSFEVEAVNAISEFTAKYNKFPEYEAWYKVYQAQIADFVKMIRNG